MKRPLSVGMDEIVVKREEGRIVLGLDPENVLVPAIISDIISADKDFGGEGKVFVEPKAFEIAKKSFVEYKKHDLLDSKEEKALESFLSGLKKEGEMFSGVFKIDKGFIETHKETIKSISAPELSDKKIEFTEHGDIIILEGMEFERVIEILKQRAKKEKVRIREI